MSKEKKDYNFLKPMKGFIVIKREIEESVGLVKAGQSEDKAYGRIIALNRPAGQRDEEDIKVGDLIVYNEYEGQELFKLAGKIEEEGLIVLKEEDILIKIT